MKTVQTIACSHLNKKKGALGRSSRMIALGLNALFLLLVLCFCDMKYEVSDDFMVDAILSGAYGAGYDEHLLFSNILLGYLLKALYQLIPVVSWYFVMQIVLCFASLSAVTYIILERNHRYVGILLSIIFISFYSDDLYLLVQFTKTAAAAVCAGGALFLYGFWQRRRKISCMIIGILLALAGSMIRFSSMYLALAFLALIFARYIWENRKQEGCWQRMMAGIGACGFLVAAAYGLNEVDAYIWSRTDAYREYKEYNHLRASVTDVRGYGYDSIATELTELDLTENDYDMLSSWNFLDEDRYTSAIIQQVSQAKKDFNALARQSVKDIWRQLCDRHYETYLIAVGIAVLLLLLLLLQPRRLPWHIFELGVMGVLLLYFFWRGRVVYRVEYSIFLCAAISLATSFEVRVIAPEHRKAFLYWGLVFGLCKAPLYLPDKSYETMSDNAYALYIYDVFYKSWNYDLRKYRCNVNARQPYGNLTAYIEADTENHYLLDFETTIQLVYYNYKPWLRVREGLWENYSYLGGVNMGYPGTYELWKENGIDLKNPYKSLVNDNIYVVDNINYDDKLNYLREHYYPNARMEMVGKVNEMQIWKYYEE